ncbi:SMI1/KNR4 family protein [Pseudomonas sp. B6002]|uniref:SMI1/KNR4 family protein n=1 Tax=Pseudomonas sp. B6002 TaxID=2726978 RepID=UPI0015A47D5B|nr:SMI1/KNR4 family protein [Pseudomonas sp. B6002]NVZ52348.1 SMI1/KNR4 family protein [Pseudomonas sp. B6002]
MNIAELNINVGGHASLGFNGEESCVRAVEKRLGHSLPQSYLHLIRSANGGHPEVGTFFLDTSTDSSVSVDWFYPLGAGGAESLEKALEDWSEVLGSSMLPFGRDGGGNVFYISLASPSGAVWYYSHEGTERILLAESFEAFLQQLIVHPDFI